MGIVYHGSVEQVHQDLARFQDQFNAVYKEVLGEHRYNIVAQANDRLLSSEVYFDDPKVASNVLGDNLFDERAPCRMTLATTSSLALKRDGSFAGAKIRTAPTFYISEHAFQNSDSRRFTDRVIASYVHEYNHYVFYVLTERPLFLVKLAIDTELRNQPTLEEIAQAKVNPLDKSQRERLYTAIALHMYSRSLVEAYEKSNTVLDKLVLGAAGFDVPNERRGKPRGYHTQMLHNLRAKIAVGYTGDPFQGFSDREIVERMLRWDEYMRPSFTTSFIDNLVDSIKEVKVSRVSFRELLSGPNKKKKKK